MAEAQLTSPRSKCATPTSQTAVSTRERGDNSLPTSAVVEGSDKVVGSMDPSRGDAGGIYDGGRQSKVMLTIMALVIAGNGDGMNMLILRKLNGRRKVFQVVVKVRALIVLALVNLIKILQI